jgi:tetratricopeptide (TPR) repeat protein
LIQDEVALSIVNNIRTKLLGHEAPPVIERHTENLEAYRLYLRGRHYWSKRTEESLKMGIRFFEEAIAGDPNYALAYAGIADSYAILGNRGALPPSDAMPRAKKAARKALALNPKLAEAHASIGLVLAVYDWNWPEAEREFQAAIDLNPGYVMARHWYAYNCLIPTGRLDEAISQLKAALDQDPVSLIVNCVLGLLYSMTHQYDAAIDQLTRARSLERNFYFAHWYLGMVLTQKKMFPEAVESLETALSLAGTIPAIVASLGQTHALAGNIDAANQLLESMKELSTKRYVASDVFAQIYAALGEREQAIAHMEKAFEEHASSMVHLMVNPIYDDIRNQAQFREIVETVGLCSPSPH